jgi:Ca2+-binding RTX toxin-like protein
MILDRNKVDLFSYLSWESYEKGGGVPPTGWEKLETSDKSNLSTNGYYGVAYQNSVTKEIVIVHRGTEPTDFWDLIADLMIGRYKIPAQFTNALKFANRIQEQYANDPSNPVIISQSGHSLGGYLAQLVTVAMGSQEGFVVNAPGAKEVLGLLETEMKVAAGTYTSAAAMESYKDRITSFNSTGDIVSKVGTQIGAMYRMPLDTPTSDMMTLTALGVSSPLTAKLFNLKMQHSIELMYKTVHATTDEEWNNGKVAEVPVDNTLLNLTLGGWNVLINAGEGGLSFLNGVIKGGPGFIIEMAAAILNGNGYDNVAMAGIASDFFRPGNNELSLLNFNDEIQRFRMTGQITTPADYIYLSDFHSASVNARTTLNIDPLVLDLNGDGVQLIAFSNSKVMFDVDDDGFKEKTAWVTPQDGILVWDKNANGQIDDITETISEYFTSGVKDGLEALKTLDTNGDNKFDGNDANYNDLRVWVDADSDGVTDPGELKTLAELNIKSIDLNRQVADRERLTGSAVLSRSTMEMVDGVIRDVAAIDFTTNPMGYEFNTLENYLGVQALSQDGTSTFLVQDPNGAMIEVSDLGVTNVYGGSGNDKITGTSKNDWIAGGAGSDSLLGGVGNDVLIIDADDLQENIDGGVGRDIVYVNDTRGVTFNLAASNIEVAVGGEGDDVFVGGGNSNVFIDGGKGDDVIVGGLADDALSGGDGDDLIDGGAGDDLIRGHRGDDALLGNAGNDFMEGGKGNDVLLGGEGDDILTGNEGNDTLDGGDGEDNARYEGNYDRYVIAKDGKDFKVTDKTTNEVDVLKNIESVTFNNFVETLRTSDNPPLPVRDIVEIPSGERIIQISFDRLFSNDLDIDGDILDVAELSNAVGGTVSVNHSTKLITFVRDPYFIGTAGFDYSVIDSSGNKMAIKNPSTGAMETMRASVQFKETGDPVDPLFYDQWYLNEIKAKGAWEDYSGRDVRVGVFEGDPGKGFNYLHFDLDGNVSEDYKKDLEFNQVVTFDQHATLVAGVIGAEKNGLGGVGVAYNTLLEGHSWHDLEKWQNVDVANNSWGFTSPFYDDFGNVAFWDEQQALLDAVGFGREGLGTALVFAGGNARSDGDNVNYHNFQNSPYVITVGSINHSGGLGKTIIDQAPFSTPGSAILVSAPGSNVKSTSNLLENSDGSTFGDDYESAEGTSFAAPIVSGIVALMLEANPNLGYRDVQKILAYTATQFSVDEWGERDAKIWGKRFYGGWKENGAKNWNGGGMSYNEDYGFGLVDAHAAVRLAEVWNEVNNQNNELVVQLSNGTDVPINDLQTASGVINVDRDIWVDRVEVSVDLEHRRLGDLIVKLISPSGAESLLMDRPGKDVGSAVEDLGIGGNKEHFTFAFSSTHYLDEDGRGAWKLNITDAATGEQGVLLNWTLKLHGAADTGKDTYVFTEDYALSKPASINDTDGSTEDQIIAASLTTDSRIDLTPGGESTIADRVMRLGETTVIENAYAGDGNDTLIGNAADNILYGGRGSNVLTGKGGTDTFEIKKNFGGRDVITDFNPADGLEKINITNFHLNDFSRLSLVQSGADAVIGLGNGQEILLKGVQASSLTAGHFVGFLNQDVVLQGSASNDNLYGDDRQNAIDGKEGDDYIAGGLGNNFLTGGAGADTFFISVNPDATDEIADFNAAGGDRISLQKFPTVKAVADLNVSYVGNDAVILLEGGQKIVLKNVTSPLSDGQFIFNGQEGIIENPHDLNRVIGTSAADNLLGTELDDHIEGREGDDSVSGGAGQDTIVAGDGRDLVQGGDGSDELYGDDVVENWNSLNIVQDTPDSRLERGGNDTIFGGAGNDSIEGGASQDLIFGELGHDTIHGGSGDDVISGGDSDSILTEGQMKDFVLAIKNGWSFYQYIDDVLLGELGNDSISGGSGADYIFGDSMESDFKGGNDTLLGGDGADFLFGGFGDDVLDGGAGLNWLDGEEGDDVLIHRGDQTFMSGGAGDDTFVINRSPGSTAFIEDFELDNPGEKIDLTAFSSLGLEFGDVDGDETLVSLYDYSGNLGYPQIQFLSIAGHGVTLDNFLTAGTIVTVSGGLVLNGTENADSIYGRTGADTIGGSGGNDDISGDKGNDILNGGEGDDSLFGGEGNDILAGGSDNDSLDGGLGNDDVRGDEGRDTLYGGDGNDLLAGGAGDDVLEGGNDPKFMVGKQISGTGESEKIYGSDGYDTVNGGAGNDTLSGVQGDDVLNGEAGDDWLKGGSGNDRLIADGSSDGGMDTLVGGLGDDYLEGGKGDDSYVFLRGDGQDTIFEKGTSALFPTDYDDNYGGEFNKILFGKGITKQDLDFFQDEKDLTIGLKNSDDRITVKGFFRSNGGESSYPIKTIEFSEGDTLDLRRDITVLLRTGADVGDQDTLQGGEGNDTIGGGKGNDVLEGGTGNDLLVGGLGDDTYVFNRGDGQDVVSSENSSLGLNGTDKITFGAGIVSTDIDLVQSGENLIVKLKDSIDQITLEKFFSNNSVSFGYPVKSLEFADGVITPLLNGAPEIPAFNQGIHLSGSDSADTLHGASGMDTLIGAGGNDDLYGETGRDSIEGGSGDDRLYGDGENDVLSGGAGNDTLNGGEGNDVYLFNRGDGQDTILREGSWPFHDLDQVIFGEGISRNDVELVRMDRATATGWPGEDLVIKIKGSDDQISLQDFFLDDGMVYRYPVSSLSFFDGSRLGLRGDLRFSGTETGETLDGADWNDTINGLGGNDSLYGSGGNDILSGGTGNDYLSGGGGEDTFVFNQGDGQDVITSEFNPVDGSVAMDKILFGAGIAREDLELSRNGEDLILQIKDTTDRITLTGFYGASKSGSRSKVRTVEFAGGSTLDLATETGIGNEIIGTKGDDTLLGTDVGDYIYGELGNNLIEGGAGDDRLYGGLTGNDTINGGAGNDLLDSDRGADILMGGPGNDTLVGGWDDDTFIFNRGDGQDVILGVNDSFKDLNGVDTIVFGPGISADELRFISSGEDLIVKLADSNDQVTLSGYFSEDSLNDGYSLDLLRFANGSIFDVSYWTRSVFSGTDGDDEIHGLRYADEIGGQAGNDRLFGEEGADVLTGGTGNDSLEGGKGNDDYVFNQGDGQDSISGENTYFESQGKDRILFGAGIGKGDIELRQSGEDLLVCVKGTDDRIALQKFISSNSLNYGYPVKTLRFSDGSELDLASGLEIAGTDGSDTIRGGNAADAISGLNGDDSLSGNSGNDVLDGGSGNDVLNGGSGDDSLSGGVGGDTMDGGDGQDSLTGGAGDDSLVGGEGSDTYFFNTGDGRDTIGGNDDWFPNSTDDIDKVVFGQGVSREDVEFVKVAEDLLIAIRGTDDKITLKNFYTEDAEDFGHPVKSLEFADHTTIDLTKRLPLQFIGTDLGETIRGSEYSDTIKGMGGSDQLLGDKGNDVLVGGKGNDLLTGGEGNDIYVFNSGDGEDRIYARELITQSIGIDKVLFGQGIGKSDLEFSFYRLDWSYPWDLVIKIKGTSDRVTLDEFGSGHAVKTLEFADSSILDLAHDGLSLVGASGADTIGGTGGPDTITGFAGNDLLAGSEGDDHYIFNLGDGQDTLSGENSSGRSYGIDRIVFGQGISRDNLEFVQTGSNLVIKIKNGTDQITLDMFFSANSKTYGYPVKFVDFIDGTSLDLTQGLSLVGTTGADTIVGTAGADTISGGSGNDFLAGGLGDDVYLFSLGDGQDIVGALNSANGLDKIVFGSGINKTDIQFVPGTNDLVIKIKNTSDQIILDDYLSSYSISQGYALNTLEFSNGEVIDLTSGIPLIGTVGADTINGTVFTDAIQGLAGNDSLVGGKGDDNYIFSLGDGQDTIAGENSFVQSYGTDKILFGQGISSQNLEFLQAGSSLVIRIKNTADQITLDNFFSSNSVSYGYPVNTLQFVDGSIFDLTQGLPLQGTTGADLVNGTKFGDTIAGLDGNDSLFGQDGFDVLRGDIGNDSLVGGKGDDTYVFNLGDGQDTISGENPPTESHRLGADRILFGSGIQKTDVKFVVSGNHVIVKITGTTDQLLLENFNSYNSQMYGYPLKRVDFSNGDFIDLAQGLPLEGTSGADTIVGTGQVDRINGLAGNDSLTGGKGDDIYIFNRGDGQDAISGNSTWVSDGTDRIQFGGDIQRSEIQFIVSGQDLQIKIKSSTDQIFLKDFWGSYGSPVRYLDFPGGDRIDLLAGIPFIGTESADVLSGTKFGDLLDGLGGNDSLSGGLGNDVLLGGVGNDTLKGDAGKDTLQGQAGNDSLVGGTENDVYVFNRGDGNDTIAGDGFTSQGIDKIVFGDGILPSDVQFVFNSADLLIRLRGTADRITLQDFKGMFGSPVKRVEFSNGDAIDLSGGLLLEGTESADTINGTYYSDTLQGFGGNDYLSADSGDDLLLGGAGNDYMIGYSGNDTFQGEAGNDFLSGSEGDDVYIFNRGDGQDTIFGGETSSNTGTDKIVFGAGVLPSDIQFVLSGWDLLIKLVGNTDQITLKSFNSPYYWSPVKALKFANGSELDISNGLPPFIGTSNNDTMNGTIFPDIIEGLGGNDSLSGNNGNDILRGGDGADRLFGDAGNDTLEGGRGNDSFVGSLGDDIYVFNPGDGSDTIAGGSVSNNTGVDKIVFGAGIGSADIVFSISGTDFLIKRAGSTDQILLQKFNDTYYRSPVQFLEFSDGSQIHLTNGVFFPGTAGNDTINGTIYSDTFQGAGGNDSLTGAQGDDVFLFNRGDGQDSIFGVNSYSQTYGLDKIILGEGIVREDFEFVGNGDHLIIKIKGSSDQVTLFGFFSSNSLSYTYPVKKVEFSDGSLLDLTKGLSVVGTGVSDTIQGTGFADIVDGLTGNDSLVGNSGDDLMKGGAGNDTLQGGLGNDWLTGDIGNDVYVFKGGDGQDTITSGDSAVGLGTDTVVFGSGIAKEDVILTRLEGDLVVSLKNSADQITLQNYNLILGSQVKSLTFADGRRIDLDGGVVFVGTAGNDTIIGSNYPDTFQGAEGDDILSGGVGDDIYVFNQGDGQDTITSGDNAVGLGADTIIFGSGILKEDVTRTRVGGDLVLGLQGTSDQITLSNFHLVSGSAVKSLEFADKQKVDLNGGKVFIGTSGNDVMSGMEFDDTFRGAGGNDTLFGGLGNDFYVFDVGDGKDTIEGKLTSTNAGTDTLLFGSSVLQENVRYSMNGNDLVIKQKSESDQITIKNYNDPSGSSLGFVEFFDGTSIDLTNGLYFLGSNTNFEVIAGTRFADTLQGAGGSDYLVGGPGDDVYLFNRGDGGDTIFVSNSTDVERIVFGDGITKDDLEFVGNYYSLSIRLKGTSDVVGLNSFFLYDRGSTFPVKKLDFSDGSSINLTQNGLDLRGLGEESDSVAGTKYDDTLSGFGGNDSLSGDLGNDLLMGGQGDDRLSGDPVYFSSGGNDTLEGGLGNDSLYGEMGNDVFLFNRGDGQDTIFGTNIYYRLLGSDKVVFGSSVNSLDVELNGSGDSLIAKIRGSSDSVSLNGFFDPLSETHGYPVKALEFNDRAILDLTQGLNISGTMDAERIKGTIYADTITAMGGDDFLSARGGNDVLMGGGGNDTLNGDGGNDTLMGGVGIDSLVGGIGADVFLFSDLGESTEDFMDVIGDFYVNQDLLDFSALGFSSTDFGGALFCDTAGGNTFVHDLNSDFAVRLNGVYALAASDFKFS